MLYEEQRIHCRSHSQLLCVGLVNWKSNGRSIHLHITKPGLPLKKLAYSSLSGFSNKRYVGKIYPASPFCHCSFFKLIFAYVFIFTFLNELLYSPLTYFILWKIFDKAVLITTLCTLSGSKFDPYVAFIQAMMESQCENLKASMLFNIFLLSLQSC